METLILVLIVALAAGFLARYLWRSTQSQTPCCGGCSVCPAAACHEGKERSGEEIARGDEMDLPTAPCKAWET
jgi:hypothetical protein